MKKNSERAIKILAKEISPELETVGLDLLVYITSQTAGNPEVIDRCVNIIRHRANSSVLDTTKMVEATLLMFPDYVDDFLDRARRIMFEAVSHPQHFVEGVVLGLVEACILWGVETPTFIPRSFASFLMQARHINTNDESLNKDVSGRLANLSSRFMNLFGPITQQTFFQTIIDSTVTCKDDHFVNQIISEFTLKTFLLRSVGTRVKIMANFLV